MAPRPKTKALKGLRVFVVEDEALVVMNLEMILEDLGCVVVGPAMRFDQAEEMVNEAIEVDMAILDVNLDGQEIFPLAERLSASDVAVIFATGYHQIDMADRWRGAPILQKPYTSEDVARSLSAALAGKGN